MTLTSEVTKERLNIFQDFCLKNFCFSSNFVLILYYQLNLLQMTKAKKLGLVSHYEYKTHFSYFKHKKGSMSLKQVDEKTRAQMFKLRQTWSSILPNQKLYMIDVKIHKMLDPAWPITAKPDKTSIHVNPKFLPKVKFSIFVFA